MSEQCTCHRCIREKNLYVLFPGTGKLRLSDVRMILCPECGNKRCPKASDHDMKCTGSNEPGQAGSIYA